MIEDLLILHFTKTKDLDYHMSIHLIIIFKDKKGKDIKN